MRTASEDVVKICRVAKTVIRATPKLNLNSNSFDVIKIKVRKILFSKPIFINLKRHEHYTFLINAILEKYLKIRYYYMASNTKKKISNRSKFNRLTIFQST